MQTITPGPPQDPPALLEQLRAKVAEFTQDPRGRLRELAAWMREHRL